MENYKFVEVEALKTCKSEKSEKIHIPITPIGIATNWEV